LIFLTSCCNCSIRLSRWTSRLNTSESSKESRISESDNVGDAGALGSLVLQQWLGVYDLPHCG
jgi:hypothetical protein